MSCRDVNSTGLLRAESTIDQGGKSIEIEHYKTVYAARIRISAKFNATGSNWSGFLHHPQTLAFPPAAIFNELFLSEVRVSRRGGNKANAFYRGSDGIYATTVHELTHAGHYRMDKDHWSVTGLLDRKQRLLILESWAEGVETILTNDRYRGICPDYFRSNNQNIGWNYRLQGEQAIDFSEGSDRSMNEYTPLFINLNDDLNQNLVFTSLFPLPPTDIVSGYTIRQMQQSTLLDKCYDEPPLRG